ncbi:MAG: hypothetical protein H6718_07735 [Polyangiaceae bacterium]|nr:hypothetical protein [Polyangiaceae bacterium]
MTRSKVFISFDYDHDRSVKEGLVAQSKDPKCPFDFVDHSIKERLSEPWVAEARKLIAASDYVAILCGVQTHQAKGQHIELQLAKELRKPYFLLRASRQRPATRPSSAAPDEVMYPATWPTVAALLRGERPNV